MRNPHLDRLTLADRVIAFVIWGCAGFLAGLVVLPPVTPDGFALLMVIAIACGMTGAIWPRAITAIVRTLWHG